MADRQIAGAAFPPWIPYYGVPGVETYLPGQATSFAAPPASWAAALGSRAWATPIFANQSWPAASSLEGTGESFPGAVQRGETVSDATPDKLVQPSSGILPATIMTGPEVPISGLSGPDGRPIYPSQLNGAPASPRSWRNRIAEALSDETVRYYAGPGFYDFLEKFKPFSPASTFQQGYIDWSNGEQALKRGDYLGAALDYPISLFNYGLSLIPGGGTLVGKTAALGAKAVATTKALPLALASFGSAFRLATLDRLKKVLSMEKAGASKSDMYFSTGIFRDIDGNLKIEIPDHDLRFTGQEGWGVGGPKSLIQHPLLKQAYPELKNLHVSFNPELSRGDALYTSLSQGRPTAARPASIQLSVVPPSELPGLAVHELQHAIQDIENFGRYGTPLNAYDPAQLERAKSLLNGAEKLRIAGKTGEAAILEQRAMSVIQSSTNADTYMNLAGEIEANNAQARALMTPGQRLATPPWETADPYVVSPIVRTHVPPELPRDQEWLSYKRLIWALRKLGDL